MVSKKLMEDVLREMEKSTQSLQEKSVDMKRTDHSHMMGLMTLLRSISVKWSR